MGGSGCCHHRRRVSDTSAATITWPASAGPNLTGYTIYRSTNGGSTWDTLTTTGTSATAYTDNTVAQGSTYLYSVIANGQGGTTSTRTTALSVTVPYQAPVAVASVTATTNLTSVSVSWPASTGPNLTGYTVVRSSDGGTTWTTLTTVGAGTASYTDTTATSGVSYLYGIIATGQGNTTSARTATTATTTLPAPGTSGVVTSGLNQANGIVEGSGGRIFTTAAGSIGIITPGSNNINGMLVEGEGLGSSLYGITASPDGYLYVAGSNFIYKVNENSGAVTTFTVSGTSPALNSIRTVAYGTDGNLYFGTTGGSVYKMNPATGTYQIMVSNLGTIAGLAYGTDGYLYVWNNSGVLELVSLSTSTLVRSINGVNGGEGLSYNNGYLYTSDGSTLWRITPSTSTISQVSTSAQASWYDGPLTYGTDGYIYSLSEATGSGVLRQIVP